MRIAVVFSVLGVVGCGSDVPRTYPVGGKVVLTGGDVAQLAGHHVEAALAGSPEVRASGVLARDGSFTLETLHEGVVRKGALEGRYQIRLLRAEEDAEGRKLPKPAVAARYQSFQTSGLSLEVPATGGVTLTLSAR